ncbi:MAG: gamma-glutamylcyclotransferase [Chitinophagaceae bacterium]|nr:gamma-glutamylcyclotransferase [Chitinophagaceae bacterium]
MEEPDYLFVYGTLRKGGNNPVTKEIINDLEWIGEAEIKARMYDIGKYPGALRAPGKKTVIKGEVLKIIHPGKVFRILDEYEGFDPDEPSKSEYRRDPEKLQLPDGREIVAWVYWYNFPVQGKRLIRHKDYFEYLKKKKSALYGT